MCLFIVFFVERNQCHCDNFESQCHCYNFKPQCHGDNIIATMSYEAGGLTRSYISGRTNLPSSLTTLPASTFTSPIKRHSVRPWPGDLRACDMGRLSRGGNTEPLAGQDFRRGRREGGIREVMMPCKKCKELWISKMVS